MANNVMPMDEILGQFGNVYNLKLENIMNDNSQNDEIEPISPSPYYTVDQLPSTLSTSDGKCSVLSLVYIFNIL